MLSKRIVAIAADKVFARKLTAGLMAAGGTVESAAALDDLAKGEIQAELVCVHVPPGPSDLIKAVNARLRPDARLIVIVDKSALDQIVDVMMAGRVAAVLVADELNPAVLSATATRLLWGDVFGLEKVVPWGVKIYSALVGDYQEKSVVISAVSDFATAMGVRRKYRESIEQVLDELLMNALYDAPVDAQGKQMFADVPTKTRISLRMEQKAIVQYTCEGDLFALSVRDAFGALDPTTVVKYLHKCLHAEQQIDRKAGGAGLGLYIIANAATQFVFNIMPGVATEVICTFDLTAAKVQLKTFGLFTERIDSAGRLAAGPSKMVTSGRATSQMGIAALPAPAAAPPASRGVTLALGAAIILLLALIGIVAYPRFVVKTGSIAVSTDPPGALIEVDGRAVGTSGPAPLVVEDLDLKQKFKVTARVDGYEPEAIIAEPGKQVVPVILKLTPRKSIVLIDSDPQGATVLVGGVERGATPATIDEWPAGSEQEVTLRRTGYSDLVRKVKVPGPGRESAVQWSLAMSPDFASVRLDSDPPGAQVHQNGELLAGLATPVAEHIIQAGKEYTYTFKLPGYQPLSQTVKLEAGARAHKLGGKLAVGGGLTVKVSALVPDVVVTVVGIAPCTDRPAPLTDCALGKGKYKVELRQDKLGLREDFEIKMDAADVVKDVGLGIVEADADHVIKAGRKSLKRVAVPAGKRQVVVVDKDGVEVKKTVQVAAGATVKVGK